MDYNKIGLWVVGVLGLLAFLGINLGGSSASNFGAIQPVGSTETNVFWWVNGLFAGSQQQFGIDSNGVLTLGSKGTPIPQISEGTCSLIGVNASITASTSVSFDCAVAGASPGDEVFAMFATSSPSTAGPGWEITRASASSTVGFITLNLTNATGATAYPPASLASTTQYLDIQ